MGDEALGGFDLGEEVEAFLGLVVAGEGQGHSKAAFFFFDGVEWRIAVIVEAFERIEVSSRRDQLPSFEHQFFEFSFPSFKGGFTHTFWFGFGAGGFIQFFQCETSTSE